MNVTNPKGIIFFAAILPQFIDVARPQLQQYAILAGTTFAVDLVIMVGYTALAAQVLRVMKDQSRLRWVNRGIGRRCSSPPAWRSQASAAPLHAA